MNGHEQSLERSMDSDENVCEKTNTVVLSNSDQMSENNYESHSVKNGNSNYCDLDDQTKIGQTYSDDANHDNSTSEAFSDQSNMFTDRVSMEKVYALEHVDNCFPYKSPPGERENEVNIISGDINPIDPEDTVIMGAKNTDISVQEVKVSVQHHIELCSTQPVTPMTCPVSTCVACPSDESVPTPLFTDKNEEQISESADNFNDSNNLDSSESLCQENSNDMKYNLDATADSTNPTNSTYNEENNCEVKLTLPFVDQTPVLDDAVILAAPLMKNDGCELQTSCGDANRIVNSLTVNGDELVEMATEIKEEDHVLENDDLSGNIDMKENQEKTTHSLSDTTYPFFPKEQPTSPSLLMENETHDYKKSYDAERDQKNSPENACVHFISSSDKEDEMETNCENSEILSTEKTDVSQIVDMSPNPKILSLNGHLPPELGNTLQSNDADVLNENQNTAYWFGLGSSTQNYRDDFHLVNYSDSDCSSLSGSIPDPLNNNGIDSDFENDHETEELQVERSDKKKTVSLNRRWLNTRFRSNGEVFPEELPPMDYLRISVLEKTELVQLGTVSGIVDILVVIKALEATPALYDDSVLFLENRQPLGLIFETFGTVQTPFYSVRFNSVEDIKERDIHVGDKILYAPKADNLTKYIFISELRKMKCDDASWEFDNEPPDGAKEFSDDEDERRAKRELNQSLKRKRIGLHGQRRTDYQKPGLMRGDLTRNPFGSQTQKYGTKPFSKWPPHDKGNNMEQNRNYNRSFRPPFPHASWINSQPNVSFGGKPIWLNQPGSMGQRSSTGVFPSRWNWGNVSGNAPSFQGLPHGSNMPWQGFGMPNVNQPVQQRPRCPMPNFTRPPPFTTLGFGPSNPTRPFFPTNTIGHAPPFPPPPFPPVQGNVSASTSRFYRP